MRLMILVPAHAHTNINGKGANVEKTILNILSGTVHVVSAEQRRTAAGLRRCHSCNIVRAALFATLPQLLFTYYTRFKVS